MSTVGNVSGPAMADAGLPANQGASSKSADGMHSQLGALKAGPPTSSNFYEEMSVAVSQTRPTQNKDDKKDKDLKKELERLKETVPDMPGMEKMNEFLSQLQNAKKNGSLSQDQIKQFSQEYSGDSSLQNMALEALIEHLRGTDDELASDLQDYNKGFIETDRVDIFAGNNLTLDVYKQAEEAGMTPQEARDDCRNNLMRVPDIENLNDGYAYAKSKAGSDPVVLVARIEVWMQELSGELVKLQKGETTALDANGLLFVRKNMEQVFAIRTMVDFSQQNEEAVNRLLANASG